MPVPNCKFHCRRGLYANAAALPSSPSGEKGLQAILQTLSLWERVAEGRVRVPSYATAPNGPHGIRPPSPRGEGYVPGLRTTSPSGRGREGSGRERRGGVPLLMYKAGKALPSTLSLWERVAEGRVRVPSYATAPNGPHGIRPPSPRGRGLRYEPANNFSFWERERRIWSGTTWGRSLTGL